MLIRYDGKRYGFSYNDVTCGQLKRIQELYGLWLKDLQTFDIQAARGSVVSSLYWLTLCQNGISIHLEAVNVKIMPFLEAFIRACNDSVFHPTPKAEHGGMVLGGIIIPEGKTEQDRQFLARIKATQEAKQKQFAEKAENADFVKLYAEYISDFAWHLNFTPDQVEAMRWHEFFSFTEGLARNRQEITKQNNAARSAEAESANAGFRV